MSTEYYSDILRAYILASVPGCGTDRETASDEEVLEIAHAENIDVHLLKRTENQRIKKITGIIKSLYPENLLDVGCGKGLLIWPLAEELPHINITAVDSDLKHVQTLQNIITAAGLTIDVRQEPAENLPYPDSTFEAVALLEILEHVISPSAVIAEAARVSSQWILISVPSRPDDNPAHIHMLNRKKLESLCHTYCISISSFEQDSSHFYILGRKE